MNFFVSAKHIPAEYFPLPTIYFTFKDVLHSEESFKIGHLKHTKVSKTAEVRFKSPKETYHLEHLGQMNTITAVKAKTAFSYTPSNQPRGEDRRPLAFMILDSNCPKKRQKKTHSSQ